MKVCREPKDSHTADKLVHPGMYHSSNEIMQVYFLYFLVPQHTLHISFINSRMIRALPNTELGA